MILDDDIPSQLADTSLQMSSFQTPDNKTLESLDQLKEAEDKTLPDQPEALKFL
jgi:hypothetical protein